LIIAGNCLFTELEDTNEIMETADKVSEFATHFRCKIWGGGTTIDKYCSGIGEAGLPVLRVINEKIPAGTEVHTPEQIALCQELSYVWIGARNSQNYSLLRALENYPGDVFIKRHPGMTMDELVGIYNIMLKIHKKNVYVVERGINTFTRDDVSRWSIDLKGIIYLKVFHPDIFDRLIVDCSHGCGRREYISDTYISLKAIGVKHFMFECTANLENAKTDIFSMLSAKELKEILNDRKSG